MDKLLPFLPHLVAMSILIGLSAFFSCSEAALFYLSHRERRKLATGNAAQRKAVQLLQKADFLLTGILFWNLVINITYFAVASLISLTLEKQGDVSEASFFAVFALMAIIFLSELLPKNIGVLRSRIIAPAVAYPLSFSLRIVAPVIPFLNACNVTVRRLFVPEISSEPYLETADLERAIALTKPEPSVLRQEEEALHNIVALSDIRAEEIMRPRRQYVAYQPPVSVDALRTESTQSGYFLVTEAESDELASALPLRFLTDASLKNLDKLCEPLIYVPWCSSVAAALDRMRRQEREIAGVVNEYGDTIGILLVDDILENIFHTQASRSARLLATTSVAQLGPGVWRTTGMTSLRRLARRLERVLPESKGVTVAGMLQEQLQRLAELSDEVEWGGLRFQVVEQLPEGHIAVEVSLLREGESTP